MSVPHAHLRTVERACYAFGNQYHAHSLTQRTVWLLPEENIINNSSDDNSSDVEDSIKVCFMLTMYFCLINALVSVTCNLIFSV